MKRHEARFPADSRFQLSSVLSSECAVQVNIGIMRAFVRLRAVASTHAQLARELEAMEQKYDAQSKVVFWGAASTGVG